MRGAKDRRTFVISAPIDGVRASADVLFRRPEAGGTRAADSDPKEAPANLTVTFAPRALGAANCSESPEGRKLPVMPLRSFAAGCRVLLVDQYTGYLGASCVEEMVARRRAPIWLRGNLAGTRRVAGALQSHMFKSTYRRHETAEVPRRLLKNHGRIPSLRRRAISRLTSKVPRELEAARFRQKATCVFVRLGLDLHSYGKQDAQVCAAVAKVLRSPTACSRDGEPPTFV